MLFYENLNDYVSGEKRKLEALASAGIPERAVVLAVFSPAENQDVRANPGRHSVTRPADRIAINCNGIEGDRHSKMVRPSTGREAPLYARTRTQVVNRRQVFAVSPWECEFLSRQLDVEVTPQLLGANLLIGREDGEPLRLSRLPVNTYLALAPADAQELPVPPIATLIHYVQQKGCGRTGRALATAFDDESLMRRFVEVSEFDRGILCSVEQPVDMPAAIEAGQQVFFRFPQGCCY